MNTVSRISGRHARISCPARLLLVVAAASLLAGCVFTGNFRRNPGYADFESPALREGDREFGLSLGPVPLKIANAVLVHNRMLSSILRDVRAVRVSVYAVDGDGTLAREHIAEARSRLVAGGWRPVVVVRDDPEFVTALVQLQEPDKIRGVVVMSADHEEVVYVNAIGKIRPKTFDRLMTDFGIDSLMAELQEEPRGRERVAEDEGAAAENGREAAENRREAAENRRQAAENGREAAETRREAAETRDDAAERAMAANR